MAASHGKKITDLLSSNGEMHSSEIYASLSEVKESTLKKELGKLKKDGEVVTPRGRSWYRLPADTSTPAQRQSPNADLKQISNALRTAEDNKKTADTLMNIYDDVLDKYKNWIAEKVDSNIDFEKQLLFIENFKQLTGIGDKLMKRWALEHVGYDTNTRQAQEDAKAKTAEREQAALKDAPLRDRVMIVGKYDPEAEELLDCIPSSLDNMTEEEKKNITV